jgi:hypothetical protein
MRDFLSFYVKSEPKVANAAYNTRPSVNAIRHLATCNI